jgi:predicted acylesterase/phospholipase RssA
MADSSATLGLALSGGGFRAAFFHLGVMARLAKAGLLRELKMISSVSGGSIIGAYYVLRLKRELEQSGLGESLDDSHYVDVMRKVELEFLHAVQQNMRMRTFADLVSNLKMIAPTYSRSDRLGELFDRYFYLPASTGVVGGKGTSVEIKDLPPQGGGIPELVINATSLNSGHAWRFGRDTMGEPWPPTPTAWDLDRSDTYFRSPSYDDMNPKKSRFSLGKAVAASAAVPGLFHPLAVSDLYENRLQLVDGGVFDNQGVDALLSRGCSHVIVSDAGGQMGAIQTAPTSFLGVALRSSSIQYGRVRQVGLERLADRLPREQIAFVHIMKGAVGRAHDWRNRRGGFDNRLPVEQERPVENSPVHGNLQRLLADIRTDLDTFNDVEAEMLMLSGYLLTGQELNSGATAVARLGTPARGGVFGFEGLTRWAAKDPTGRLQKILGAARSRFSKLLKIRPVAALGASALAYLPITLLILGLGFLAWTFGPRLLRATPLLGDAVEVLANQFRDRPFWWALVSLIAGLVVSYGFARYAAWVDRVPAVGDRLARTQGAVRTLKNAATLVTRAIVAVLAFFVAWPSMRVIDPIYRRAGRIDRLSDSS